MPPDCNDCGDPATSQIDTGAIRTARGWRRAVIWLCDACAREAVYEREEQRRG